MAYPRVNCRKLMHVTLSLDFVILLFEFSCICSRHFRIVLDVICNPTIDTPVSYLNGGGMWQRFSFPFERVYL